MFSHLNKLEKHWTDSLSVLHLLPCVGYALQKQLKIREKIGMNNYSVVENKLGKLKHYNSKPFAIGAKQQSASGYNIQCCCLWVWYSFQLILCNSHYVQSSWRCLAKSWALYCELAVGACVWHCSCVLASYPCSDGKDYRLRGLAVEIPCCWGTEGSLEGADSPAAATLQDVIAGAVSQHNATIRKS